MNSLTGQAPKIVLADRGYRGVEPPEGTRLLISHTRRQVVEPMIGHMKSDGLLAKSCLKGATGDAPHAILCGAAHNLRMILAPLWVPYYAFIALLSLVAPSARSASAANERLRLS